MTELFLTEAEVADILGVHRTTVRRAVDTGQLPLHPIFITPHTRRFRRDEVESLTGRAEERRGPRDGRP